MDADLERLTTDGFRPVPNALSRAIDELERLVTQGRPVPMSSSVMVNKADFERVVATAREALPAEFAAARRLLADRAGVIEDAQAEAEALVEAAEARRRKVLQRASIVREARSEAERLVLEATERAEQVRLEADDYVDRRLANFEVVLQKTLSAVDRGRLKLRGRLQEADMGDLAAPFAQLDGRDAVLADQDDADLT